MISVVVPVHDEEHSVEPLFGELRAALDPLDTEWEVLFVDDGSTDGTFGALMRLHDREPRRAHRPAAAELREGDGARRRLRPGGAATSS